MTYERLIADTGHFLPVSVRFRLQTFSESERMNEAGFLRLVRGETLGIRARFARLSLSAASIPYVLVVGLRNLAFDRGWKKSHRAGVPVVAVGNLTLGGTGKTPMVEWVGRWLRAHELQVAILSRGYGDSAGMNDEGRVLEENLPEVPHLQGADRVALARIAVEELESEVLVLDDGFQHRRLARDLDIVLIDALEPFGLGRIFPRGLLREPVRSLKRAGVVVLSRADLVDEASRLAIRQQAEDAAGPLAWVTARHAPRDLIDFEGRSFEIDSVAPLKVAAFCGIGNPEGFRRTLERLGLTPVGFRAFPDHHGYSGQDVADLSGWLRDLGAEVALTTQKDLVKLRTPGFGPLPLRALRIGLEVIEGLEVLETALAKLLPPGKDAP